MKQGLTNIIIAIANTDYPPCHYTGNCIGSIKHFTKLPYEIIIVDNASTIELGGLKWEEIVNKYIKLDKNYGVAYAWNRGIEASEGEFVCIMNSDIQVFEHWLEDLQEALQHIQAVTAYPMYDLPYGRAVEAATRRQEWLSKTVDQYLTDFMDFSCVLTTKKIFDEVGLFDEGYGVGYGEDVDWRFRLREKGYVIKANKRVNIHHVGGATAYTLGQQGLKLGEIMNKNKEYTKQKWDLDQYGVPKFIRERIK